MGHIAPASSYDMQQKACTSRAGEGILFALFAAGRKHIESAERCCGEAGWRIAQEG